MYCIHVVFAAPVCPSILTGTVRGTDSGGTDCWRTHSGGSDCSYSEIVIQEAAIAGIVSQEGAFAPIPGL